MTDATTLVALLLLPFAGSIVAALLPVNARNAEAWLAGGIALAAVFVVSFCFPSVASGNVLHSRASWLPQFELEFSLRMDGYAWLFAFLVTTIGFLVALYARYYMSPKDPVPRFFSFLLAFMGSMLGVVLSGNLIQIVFFWELTSLFSFLLIGYWHHSSAAREGARMALIVTSAGGLLLFVGMLLVGRIVGSYDLDAVLSSADRIRTSPLYLPALVLVVLGALTKSAQFPFHFWLPHAMAAPTPVSAYLHSAAMVKLGVFLLARLWPVLSGTDAWMWVVGTTGLATFVFGAYTAIFQYDLKGLLAYSTISHLGLITLLLGLNSPFATVAAIFHMINHATFKASLFMAAGVIDHESGTRDIRRLSGLVRAMPISATLAIVAAAAMAGVPLLNGFLSKEMFFAEALDVEGPSPLIDRALPYVATLAAMFSVAYSLRFIHGAFFGPDPQDLPRMPQEPPRWMRFPIELLVLACVLVGMFPAQTIGPFLDVAVRAVLGADTPSYSLAVWHGFNRPLLMSVLALAGGTLLYVLLRKRLAQASDRVPLVPDLDGRSLFDRVLVAISWRGARSLERLFGTARLKPQLRWLVTLSIAAASLPVWVSGLELDPIPPGRLDIVLALVWVIGLACAIGAAWQAKFHRLVALMLAGGAGLATCVTFVWFSAPDLALTQLLVEIVTTVLILLGLRWLPKRIPASFSWPDVRAALPRRTLDLVIALAAGGGLATLAYAVMTRPRPEAISEFFVTRAYPAGGGSNVVNVILVDFRGFDTLGEITVLGVTAIAVYALLRRFRPARESLEPPRQQREQDEKTYQDDMMVSLYIMRLVFPVIAVLAGYLLIRGHNLPGGGFVAGLTMAVAMILQYMAGGVRWAEARLALRPLRLIGVGLAIACATGAGAWWFAHPFLTSHTAHVVLPLLGELHLPSVFLFDLGVFCLVVGATALILIALSHQSIRTHRAPPS
ncbi:MAG: monovalent cation/H+ antiporter subunit A [Burkholderiales bacterium]|nr:monovalent cation/H+ antiporter subunit A [Burkholderiales bacterium]